MLEGLDAAGMLAELERERRAVRVRVRGEERWIDAVDAGLYRDALGVAPPGGLPAAFLEDVPDALVRVVRRYAATHGPFTSEELRARYGVDCSAVLASLERADELVRGELRPGGSTREWCHPEVLRRLRRASLAVLRKEIEPADQRALARFLPAWQSVDRHPATGAGIDRLREALVPLQGLALPPDVWERDVLPRRVGAYSPAWMDQLCASGEIVWIGAGALGRNSGRVALYFREDVAVLGPPPFKGAPPDSDAHARALRDPPCRGRLLLHGPARRRRARAGRAAGGVVGPRLGGRGDERRLLPPASATADARSGPARADEGFTVRRPAAHGRRGTGPGTLVADGAAVPRGGGSGGAPQSGRRAAARALRDPHPRAGSRRGRPRRVLGDLLGAHAARDARDRPAWLLRRGPGRRPVRDPRGGRAAPGGRRER